MRRHSVSPALAVILFGPLAYYRGLPTGLAADEGALTAALAPHETPFGD